MTINDAEQMDLVHNLIVEKCEIKTTIIGNHLVSKHCIAESNSSNSGRCTILGVSELL